MDVFAGLNKAQQEAVKVLNGPLLILAGAGSGKTTTLTHRIANLILHGTHPNEILAVTFTNKAAKSMRNKLGKLLDRDSENRDFMPYMGTFHSICVKLLRFESAEIGLSSNFVIFDESDRSGLIKQIIREIDPSGQTDPRAVTAAISKAKNDFLDPEEYETAAKGPREKQVAKIYAEYETRRRKNSALDFDDLLVYTAKMFQSHKEVRTKWQNRFKHILIDEYQDTNAVQYKIIKSLVGKDRNICVVGDDWQSIYSWRGADFTNILNFERDFPGGKVIKLEQNYRSTGPILAAAQNIIVANKQRTDKELWTDKKQGEPVTLANFYDDEDEATAVTKEIIRRAEENGQKLSDFAILYRTNAQSYHFEKSMLEAQVHYKILGGLRFFDRKEIKDVMAYLRLIYQPNDIVSFSRIYNTPSRKLGSRSLDIFSNYFLTQMSDDYSLISALLDAEQILDLTKSAKAAFSRLGEILAVARTRLNDAAPTTEVVKELVDDVGYSEYLKNGEGGEERSENVKVLINEIGNYPNLEEFLADAALMSSADEEAKDAVSLMTLHSAKGLEFPVVFVVGVEEDHLPSSQAVSSGLESEIEEERRLLYVGMTRAQEKLFLSFSGSRYSYGKRTYCIPSRFLADLGDGIEIVENNRGYKSYNTYKNNYKTSESKKTKIAKPKSRAKPNAKSAVDDGIDQVFEDDFAIWSIGDRVQSERFGAGTISEVDGASVEVNFDSGAAKKLNLEYARLTRAEN